ncbi:hypothetical protein AIN02nite_28580 [Acetobacter indonesiensis]|uniref:Uncharacterized protein n=1 Tax=Acetobacter indonesiensis TaxID=104101 RepID=A0A6N3T7A9_9PROT|nr:hypothetical protein Abin_070_006 [Acetobacter indonesiensis]GEN04833.1 hypothetical protein AIN02nite_28580 [Acetobacter indonesiensis]
MCADLARIGKNEPTCGLRRKPDRQIGIVAKQSAKRTLRLEPLSSDQNETQCARRIAGISANRDCEPEPSQAGFPPLDRISHNFRYWLSFNQLQ